MSSFKAALYLTAGALLVPCFGSESVLRLEARAQENKAPLPFENRPLPEASEAQVKAWWQQLQADSLELEATDPGAAITRYQRFFEAGASRAAPVGLQISLRIARLYQLDLRDYDKALAIYDWALALYKDQPGALELQKGRVEALKALDRAEGATEAEGTAGKEAPPPAKAQQNAPLTVEIAPPVKGGGTQVPSLGVGVPSLKIPSLGVGASPLGVGAPTLKFPSLGVGVPQTKNANTKIAVETFQLMMLGNALGWAAGPQRCVTALAQAPDGAVWVATEESGVWRYAPATAVWTQFTAKDGLADESAYALAVDKQGRVWAGTLNHGVSVWNGKGWKNYGVLDGPLGERVFDIAVCPRDGDVWLATNAGLTRYSQQKDSWSYVTRADGLPSDQIQAIAFDKNGDMLLGTPCDGVAMAGAADGYKSWRVVGGPQEMPVSATGKGLPTSLINDVLVASDGTFYAATTTGLAWSSDKGANWSYARGQDYADKVRGLYGGAPKGWKEGRGAVLAEDYVSCLAQDEAGRLWLGHWKQGSEMLEMQSGPAGLRVKEVSNRQKSGLVRDILPRDQGGLLLARHDQGLSYGSLTTASNAAVSQTVGKGAPPALPTAAKAPTLGELNALLASLSQVEPLDAHRPLVTALADDWTTQGDWLGRYGRYWASLNAMVSPSNYYWGGGWTQIDHRFQIDPRQKNDALRYWVHWLYTDNTRSLEMPPTYLDSRLQKGLTTRDSYRRQAELDDHGEAYPMTKEGPHIYLSVDVPSGLWNLSFYNFNANGENATNWRRDYRLSLRAQPSKTPLGQVDDFADWPELAHGRFREFRGGVYKRFLVRGPQRLTVKMDRNNSYNTIWAGAFLDMVDEKPAPYFGTVDEWKKRQSERQQKRDELSAQTAEERAARFAPAKNLDEAVNRLFIEIERLRDSNPLQWSQRNRSVYQALARATSPALTEGKDRFNTLTDNQKQVLNQRGGSFYNLTLYNSWEELQRQLGLFPARDVEKALRWDGLSSGGEGFQVISGHLSSLPPGPRLSARSSN